MAGLREFVLSTGDAKTMVAYCARASALVNGEESIVRSGWPGEPLPHHPAELFGGSHTSTVKPLSAPSSMSARVVSSMCEWRKPSVSPTTRIL